jgi:poly [ADP-ribose] polymerase 10/14/15
MEVATSSKEYRFISALFLRTAKDFTIIQIQQIRNDDLLHKFTAVKEAMDSRGRGIGSNEMQLFHGTSSKNIDAINMGGLNRSFTTTHVYGKGVYFARDASYSAQDSYSPPDNLGAKRMYLARVLVGDTCAGKSDDIQPSQPRPGAANPFDLCDSTIDSQGSPSIYVTYKDNQQYPEYLIVFKRQGPIQGGAG